MFSIKFLNRNKTIFNSFYKKQISHLQQNYQFNNLKSSNYGHTLYSRSSNTSLSMSKRFRNPNLVLKSLFRGSSTEVAAQNERVVGYWLLGCSGMVIVAVILGGVTRLTESGLSMVTWRLLGEKFPRTDEEWIAEFKKYQEYPEYKFLKRGITLEEFKWIWRMEFVHRTWGRFIGGAFYIPAAFFWLKGYLTPSMKKRVGIFGLLIAMQGLLGWYMVKSGLEDRFHEPSDVPRVSQYRLAAHLGLAFALYTGMLYSAFKVLIPVQKAIVSVDKANILRRMSHISRGLIFLTALSGAFVAGLDAGFVYNSFPKMGEKWLPEDILALSPIFINFTENPATVQFQHRVLGISTLAVIIELWMLSRKCLLPPRAKRAVNALASMGLLQVILGISTLVNYVPVFLAATHQSGSLILLSFSVWLTHELRFLKYVPK